MDSFIPYVTLAIILIAYPVLMRSLAYLVRPVRDALADLGRELLSRENLTRFQRYVIREMINDAFDWKVMAKFSFFAPYYLSRSFFKKERKLDQFDRDLIKLLRDKNFQEFLALHIISVSAASPLFALIVAIELQIGKLFARIFGALKKWDKESSFAIVRSQGGADENYCSQ